MQSRGFEQGKYSPSTYYHKLREIKTLVHGDDCVSSAKREHAAWFEEELRKRFEIKTHVIGRGDGEKREKVKHLTES